MSANCTQHISRPEFRIMVVGQSQVGKTSFIDALLSPYLRKKDFTRRTEKFETLLLTETSAKLYKGGKQKVFLTLMDTPAIMNSNDWAPLVDYIESKYEAHLRGSNGEHNTTDRYVHCCLYLIKPTVNGLSPLDVECMTNLCDKVNIVPVITKSDMMTKQEHTLAVNKVMSDINTNKIFIYPAVVRHSKLFVVVNPIVIEETGCPLDSNTSKLKHNFFVLRKRLFGQRLENLKNSTVWVHYENYKRKRRERDFCLYHLCPLHNTCIPVISDE